MDSKSLISAIIFSSRLRYWYVTEYGREVLEKDKAMVTIDGKVLMIFGMLYTFSKYWGRHFKPR